MPPKNHNPQPNQDTEKQQLMDILKIAKRDAVSAEDFTTVTNLFWEYIQLPTKIDEVNKSCEEHWGVAEQVDVFLQDQKADGGCYEGNKDSDDGGYGCKGGYGG